MLDLEENKRKLIGLQERFVSLEKAIGDIKELELKLKVLEEKTLEEGFWNDTKKSNTILQEIKDIKGKYTGLNSIKQTLGNLLEMNEFLILEEDEELGKELILL